MTGIPTTCLAGERYGRLSVRGEAEKTGMARRVECACDCGTVRTFQVSGLQSGRAKSCGCLHREVAGARAATLNRTHGEGHGTTEYIAWKGIWDRCTRPKNKSFLDYGGRGIGVCDAWRSYEAFLSDMGRKPSPKHSIDRIDTNGDYSKANCRWALPLVQANNTRRNRVLEIAGVCKTISQWSRESGLPPAHIWARLNLGWESRRAVFEPRASRAEAMRRNQRLRWELVPAKEGNQ